MPLKLAEQSADHPDVEPAVERPRRVRPIFLVALALAVVALVVQRTWFPWERAPWHGTTAQANAFALGWERGGSVRFVETRLDVFCEDRTVRSFDWTPHEGIPVHFVRRGPELRTTEVSDLRNTDGVRQQIVVRLRGRLGDDAARGTMRATARYSGGKPRRLKCDSGDVEWSAAR